MVGEAGGEVVYVDDDANLGGDGQSWETAYEYLQDALYEPAVSGDEIWVAAGTYKPDEDEGGSVTHGDRTATFQLINGVAIYGGHAGAGAADPNERNIEAYESILSGDIGTPDVNTDNTYHVVTGSGTDSTTILDGVTVTKGAAYHPGLSWEDPRVRGGGIFVASGSPTIRNCVFVWNFANWGGGMYNNRSNPLLENCVFRGNWTRSTSYNKNGGGMSNVRSHPNLVNCTFVGNQAIGHGGAMFNYTGSRPTLTNCIFGGNWAGGDGGGMFNGGGGPKVTNCLFSGNSANRGGGIRNWGSEPTVTNCTFTGNSARGEGGGLSNGTEWNKPKLTNCILWRNRDSSGINEPAQVHGVNHIINYCCIQALTGNLGGIGNIAADPCFIDMGYWDAEGVWVDGDYHLQAHSPCINAGNPAAAYTGQTDIDCEPRLMKGRVDIGVDEYPAVLVGLVISGSEEVDEQSSAPYAAIASYDDNSIENVSVRASWSVEGEIYVSINQYGVLAVGDADVPEVVTIHAQYTEDVGTVEADLMVQVRALPPRLLHVPADYETIQAAIDMTREGDDETVVVADGVYTGNGNRDIDFRGRSITVRSEDGPDNCIIDCQGTGTESHRGFCFQSGEGDDSVLEGFTIRNGWTDYSGAGIFCFRSSPTISQCILTGNVTGRGGAGIYCRESDAIISGCTVTRNTAIGRAEGGGICLEYSRPTMVNCIISGNSGIGRRVLGGGIYCQDSNAAIANCTIIGNCTEFGEGGGMYNRDSSLTLTNCTLSENAAGEEGGGMYNTYSSTTVANCILSGNRDTGGTDESAQIHIGEGTMDINYSCIQGWTGALGGTGNIDADPCFVAPGYWDANGIWVEGDYHLLPDSPCIDAGDNNSVPADTTDLDGDGNRTEPIPWDVDGYPRIADGDNDGEPVVDMGAYEFFVPPVEVAMRLTPQALNPGSKGRWVKAHFVLPEEFSVEDVDANRPAVIEPGGIESEYMNVFVNEDGLVEIEAAFSRDEFCSIVTGDEAIEVTAIGRLTSGQQFYGTDIVKVTSNALKYLASLASYWLEAGCGKPDWCGGLDVDQDSVVNFVDFALFDGCCVEIIGE